MPVERGYSRAAVRFRREVSDAARIAASVASIGSGGGVTSMLSRRTKGITIKVTNDEYAVLAGLADGQTVTAWVHDVVLATATPHPGDQILLAELLALRTILLNLHFAIASGEPPTLEAMKRLIERADDEKQRRALERLTASPWRP
jgi:hypothetical protein